MRVTNRMLHNTLLTNLNRNLRMMQKTQEQMSSGKKISRPSDNPIDTTLIMGMQSIIAEQEVHIKNMDDGIGWLEATDKALGNVGEVLARASELALQGSTGTSDDASRLAIAQEIGQLIDELKQIFNTNYAGRYIFGGTNTGSPPFVEEEIAGVTYTVYKGNGSPEGDLNWEIAPGVTMAINATGAKAFAVDLTTDPKEPKMITVLKNIKQELETSGGDPGAYTDELNAQVDHILQQRAVAGAKVRRLEMAQARSSDVVLDLKELNSKLEDIDIAEATMNYAMQEAVYQAALMTGAKILQPSLLNFLD